MDVASQCRSELDRNSALRVPENNQPSIAEMVLQVACSNACSGQGICDNGMCRFCQVGEPNKANH